MSKKREQALLAQFKKNEVDKKKWRKKKDKNYNTKKAKNDDKPKSFSRKGCGSMKNQKKKKPYDKKKV